MPESRNQLLLKQLQQHAEQGVAERSPKTLMGLCFTIKTLLDQTFNRWGHGSSIRTAPAYEREEMGTFWLLVLQKRYPHQHDYFSMCKNGSLDVIVERASAEHAVFDAVGGGSSFRLHREHAYKTCAAIEAACREMLGGPPLTLPAPKAEPEVEPSKVVDLHRFRESRK
jgi:hypothetical protein